MAIEWNTTEQVFKYKEGDIVDLNIYYSASNPQMVKLSSTLPSGFAIQQFDGYIKIIGTLPTIMTTTSYFATIRITEYENGKVVDLCDRYFEIVSESLPVSWDKSETGIIDTTIYVELNQKLQLNNTNGNEVFKKVSGELPSGINLSADGVLYGSITDVNELQNSPYRFTIDVFVNGQSLSLEKSFTLNIHESVERTEPYWITEEGILGNISFNDISKFKVLAYDMSGGSTLSYELDKSLDSSYRLPPGLKLNGLNGKIEGILSSSQYATYTFGVIASKLVNGEKIDSKPRLFSIKANDVSKEHQLIWEDDGVIDLGTYSVGNEVVGYVPPPTVEDGSEIRYYLSGGDIPKGLLLNTNGTFGGVLEYQPTKDYYFTIIVETKYISMTKNVKMHVVKGLGKNAIKMYLRINNEYRDEYLNIKNQFNPNTAYKSHNENFVVDSFPKIDVATLTCYDREVLSHIINFGNPVVLRIKDTDILAHSQINNYGQPIENYEVIYKNIDESTYQWEELNNGSYNFEEKLEMLKGEGQIDNSSSLEFNNSMYNLDNTTPKISYSVFNFKNFRELLTQKFYVYKKEGEYYYSVGSQELFDLQQVSQMYNLYKVIETDDDGRIQKIEYRITNSPQISSIDKVVEYKNNCVYDNNTPMLSVLFTPCVVSSDETTLIQTSESFIIYNEDSMPYYLKKITNPYCFSFDKNKGTITISTIPSDSEMVLPMITDSDVIYDEADTQKENGYIKFLDYNVEKLPEWKRTRAKEWTANTQYLTNDVIIYDSVYYECKQQFKSGSMFEYDTNILTILTNEEVNKLLSKNFFPTLDLGYYEVGTNRYYMAQIHEKEKNGEFWYNRDFLFYQIICEPIFNREIDKFAIWFKKEDSEV